ncbi:MAG: hypothetical protein H0X72_02240 [Acidobacteria bacterium]|jgi:hypothetical protein|nr:hypothetical protein [Acidobacteriota bacterium]
MGQLIIEIPFDVTRRYQIKNTKLAADMLAKLDMLSLGENPPRQQIEDLEDLIAAEESYAEEGRISWKNLKAELGL